MKNIKVIILKSGIEIISEMEGGLAEGSISLHRPLKQVVVPLPMQGPEGIQITFTSQLMPLFSLIRRENVHIDVDEVWVINDAPKALEDVYLQMTSGIKIPTANSAIIRG